MDTAGEIQTPGNQAAVDTHEYAIMIPLSPQPYLYYAEEFKHL